MKLKQMFVGAVFAAGLSLASAATVSYDAFVLDYNDDTVLGSPSFSFNGGGGLTGFGWTLPSDIQVISLGGDVAEASFNLPTFTITAKPGWVLSGPLHSLLGNVVFNEVSSFESDAATSMSASADVSFDGGATESVGGLVARVITTTSGVVTSGYYRDTAESSHGSFSSLTVSNAVLSLRAEGGVYASIIAQPQNVLEFSITAAPVPEPESWALLMAGLGLVGYVARRRRAARG